MNREIKFRIWDKENNEMIYKPTLGVGSGSQVIAIGLDGHITLHNMFGLPDGSDVTKLHDDRFHLMQYTGLKDKNGKEIYEGDIVELVKEYHFYDDYHTGEPIDTERKDTIIAEVRMKWYSGVQLVGKKKSWNINDDEEIHDWKKYIGRPSMFKDFSEIIGNVHTTPEILER